MKRLDVTDSPHCYGSATLIAVEIRQTIFNELQLTASAGVAPVKFLAKIASDLNKPNGQYVITPADVPGFLKTLPLAKIRAWESFRRQTGKYGVKNLRGYSTVRSGDASQTLR